MTLFLKKKKKTAFIKYSVCTHVAVCSVTVNRNLKTVEPKITEHETKLSRERIGRRRRAFRCDQNDFRRTARRTVDGDSWRPTKIAFFLLFFFRNRFGAIFSRRNRVRCLTVVVDVDFLFFFSPEDCAAPAAGSMNDDGDVSRGRSRFFEKPERTYEWPTDRVRSLMFNKADVGPVRIGEVILQNIAFRFPRNFGVPSWTQLNPLFLIVLRRCEFYARKS